LSPWECHCCWSVHKQSGMTASKGWLKNCGRRGRRRDRLLHGIMSAMSKAFSLVAAVGLGGALAFTAISDVCR
jgi:hypothetical protein